MYMCIPVACGLLLALIVVLLLGSHLGVHVTALLILSIPATHTQINSTLSTIMFERSTHVAKVSYLKLLAPALLCLVMSDKAQIVECKLNQG